MEPRERSEPMNPHSVSGWRGGCRVLGSLGVVLFLACAYTPLPNVLIHRLGTQSRIETAGAIVVLGARVFEDGLLGSVSLRRAVQGIVLQRKGLAPLLVLSGPTPDAGPSEAEVRAALARDLGIPSDAVLTETGARTTREEANRIGALLRAKHVHRILLVTDSQHMRRARRLFERVGLEVLPAAVDDISDTASSPEDRLKLTRTALEEIIARFYYQMARYM
jgi:uncharacterized SAM-binding protein YcdF (DUF218 family)